MCVCRWETSLCTWKCSLFRTASSHQHWKLREPSWRAASESRSTSSMPKSKCEQLDRDRKTPLRPQRLNYNTPAPVLSCCWEWRTTIGLYKTFLFSTTWRSCNRSSAPSAKHMPNISPALIIIWDDNWRKLEAEPTQCLRPVNAWSLTSQTRSY